MIEEQIGTYCRLKGFRPQTLSRWLGFNPEDRGAILRLVQDLKPGENHFKDILDWLEEIALRDGVGIAALLRENLSRITSDPRLGRNDKLKRVKEELWRLRFPRLARIETEIHGRVREMKLGPELSVTVPPGLEGGVVTLQIKAASHEEMKRLAGEAARVAETDAMKEIFALLSGESPHEKL